MHCFTTSLFLIYIYFFIYNISFQNVLSFLLSVLLCIIQYQALFHYQNTLVIHILMSPNPLISYTIVKPGFDSVIKFVDSQSP